MAFSYPTKTPITVNSFHVDKGMNRIIIEWDREDILTRRKTPFLDKSEPIVDK